MIAWHCHFCDDLRPDAQISVVSRGHVTSSGVEIQRNLRYCNDRDDCRHAAHAWLRTGELVPVVRRRGLLARLLRRS